MGRKPVPSFLFAVHTSNRKWIELETEAAFNYSCRGDDLDSYFVDTCQPYDEPLGLKGCWDPLKTGDPVLLQRGTKDLLDVLKSKAGFLHLKQTTSWRILPL